MQGKVAGYETDDLIAFMGDEKPNRQHKLLGQAKINVAVTKSDEHFKKTIHGAWWDFNNKKLFTKGRDKIALITGPISKKDVDNVFWILERNLTLGIGKLIEYGRPIAALNCLEKMFLHDMYIDSNQVTEAISSAESLQLDYYKVGELIGFLQEQGEGELIDLE